MGDRQKPSTVATWTLALVAMAGCQSRTSEPSAGVPVTPIPAPVERSSQREDVIPTTRQDHPRYSYETEADHRFADFLRDHSGGMVRQAAVGLEREGRLRVQLGQSTAPDDTLPLTKSILSGVRKDFPGRPFTLSIYDPQGEPILRARVTHDGEVRYEVVHDSAGASPTPGNRSETPSDPMAPSGSTSSDRRFAEWAEDHGQKYLRYLQADLERHGRLWFGVTREVRPADVPDLTRSLLEGAHRAFPNREIVATAFDPAGERIGRARLASDGQVTWEH